MCRSMVRRVQSLKASNQSRLPSVIPLPVPVLLVAHACCFTALIRNQPEGINSAAPRQLVVYLRLFSARWWFIYDCSVPDGGLFTIVPCQVSEHRVGAYCVTNLSALLFWNVLWNYANIINRKNKIIMWHAFEPVVCHSVTFGIPTIKRKQHGGAAFSFSAAQIWHSLPFALRHSPSLLAFKANLVTYLFKQYFDQ